MRKKQARYPGKTKLLNALTKTKGIKVSAAKALGCERKTLDAWIKRAGIEDELKHLEQEVVDVALSKLFVALTKGERWAIERVLDTKGRGTGWSRHDDESADQPSVIINLGDGIRPPDE